MEPKTKWAPPWGGVELLERALGYLRWSLCSVTQVEMSAPTPCTEWDLGGLLLHLDDSLRSLDEACSTGRVGDDASPTVTGDLVDAIRGRACALLGGWSAAWTPGGVGSARDVLVRGRPLTSPVLVSAGALEVAVHAWDIAVACGVPRPIPGDLAVDLLRIAPVLVTSVDRPERFAPALELGAPGSPSEVLLAFLGRAPVRGCG